MLLEDAVTDRCQGADFSRLDDQGKIAVLTCSVSQWFTIAFTTFRVIRIC
jgi:hypothetical protein